MGETETTALSDLDAPPAIAVPPWPKRRRRLRIDPATVVQSAQRWVQEIIDDQERAGWYERRLHRYAKYRGWLAPKTQPWPGASNVHIPLLQTAELRLNAGLHNVLMTMRPLVSAKATDPADLEKEERITQLLDTQLFLDPGPERAARVWGDYVSAFGQDGNAVLYCPWVREEREITEVLYRDPVPMGAEPEAYLAELLGETFPGAEVTRDGDTSHRYVVDYVEAQRAKTATVEVFLADDEGLELVVTREATLYDGPVALPVELDDLFVPTRCDNLQPPSAWNPRGAGRVALRVWLSVDAIRRNQRSGKYNWLDADGLAAIEAQARQRQGLQTERPDEGTSLKQQKDTLEGRDHVQPTGQAADEPGLGQVVVPCLLVFDQWDVNGDGLLEDTVWLVAEDAEQLCEARLLTELWPATRPYRPLAEAVCIPVPGRWYGLSLVELGEHLQDLVKATFDMAYDAATLTKRPFFFYAANAKMPLDVIGLAPGDGYPVSGDPRTAVYFPTISAGDQSWAFQVIGLAMQAFERVMMLGDLQLGRVPTGKASALRTVGTTAALLQQGDVRADQMLLRLFHGVRQVARFFHAMNRQLLPPGKEIRRLGWDGPTAQAYLRVDRARDIDAEVEFDFRPDFLQGNAETLAAALEGAMGYVLTPFAFQLGITDPVKAYTLVKDAMRARKLDYQRYLTAPTPDGGAPIFAEEAISLLLKDRLPQGTVPAEGVDAHAKKLFEFLNSEIFGMLTPAQSQLFQAYLADIGRRAQQEAMAQAAGLFQRQQQQTAASPGVPTTVAAPEMGTGAEATGQLPAAAMGAGTETGA